MDEIVRIENRIVIRIHQLLRIGLGHLNRVADRSEKFKLLRVVLVVGRTMACTCVYDYQDFIL